jgi:hypothetical protein
MRSCKVSAVMSEPTIQELQDQIHELRNRVMSLSARLLCKIAVESTTPRPLNSADAEALIREAEECFRCARIPGLKSEIAVGLEAAGRELMARAVEIVTGLQRDERKK